MQDLKKAWKSIDNYDFRVERFEPDIDFAQITSQSESVLLITFEILFGESSYMMNLCFATFAFDTILSKLSSKNLSTIRPQKYHGTTPQEIIAGNLVKTYLPVTVEFGKAKISMQELIDLEPGDIIKINTKVNDEHPIKVGNRVLFAGRSGTVNKRKAVKITRRLLNNEN